MEKNIFEGAKFGDIFLTRGGKKAVYCRYHPEDNEYYLLPENRDKILSYTNEGRAFYYDDNYVHKYREILSDIMSRCNKIAPEEKTDAYNRGCEITLNKVVKWIMDKNLSEFVVDYDGFVDNKMMANDLIDFMKKE